MSQRICRHHFSDDNVNGRRNIETEATGMIKQNANVTVISENLAEPQSIQLVPGQATMRDAFQRAAFPM